jgi:ubiquinone/menaquinone biosynthesis C-methylase UbiE
MRYIHDPEGVEVSHLISACQPRGKKILEIGCGHGTLTFQYAGLPRLVMGVDPDQSELNLAKGDKRTSEMNISFIRAKGEGLPYPSQCFDIVLFASSL